MKKQTPDWLGYLLSVLVIFILVFSECNREKLTKKFEEKYIYE